MVQGKQLLEIKNYVCVVALLEVLAIPLALALATRTRSEHWTSLQIPKQLSLILYSPAPTTLVVLSQIPTLTSRPISPNEQPRHTRNHAACRRPCASSRKPPQTL